MTTTLSFKVIYKDEIRRFTKPRPTFQQFNAILHSLLGTSYPSLRVCYRDEEGDVISVSSELEWESALEFLLKDRLVRLFLFDRTTSSSVVERIGLEVTDSVQGSALDTKNDKETLEESKRKFLQSLQEEEKKKIEQEKEKEKQKEKEEKERKTEEHRRLLLEEKEKLAEEKRKLVEEKKRLEEVEKKRLEEVEKKKQEEVEKKRQEEAEKKRQEEIEKENENKRLEEERRKEEADEERRRLEEVVEKALEEAEEKRRNAPTTVNTHAPTIEEDLLNNLTEEWEQLETILNKDGKKGPTVNKEAEAKQEQAKEALLELHACKAKFQPQLDVLAEMGFTDEQKNLQLLQKHQSDLAPVLDELVRM